MIKNTINQLIDNTLSRMPVIYIRGQLFFGSGFTAHQHSLGHTATNRIMILANPRCLEFERNTQGRTTSPAGAKWYIAQIAQSHLVAIGIQFGHVLFRIRV